MAGGGAIFQRSGVRDVHHDFCERGGLRPESAALQVLRAQMGRDGQHGLADVLCVPALSLARRLPDGPRSIRVERVRLDIAVVNAPGQGHRAVAALAAGSAAEAYAAEQGQRPEKPRTTGKKGSNTT